MNARIKLAESIIFSAIALVIYIATITIAADLLPALKESLKNTFSHHWIGKSLTSAALFVGLSLVLLLIPFKTNPQRITRLLWILIALTILSTLVILGFFSLEALLK